MVTELDRRATSPRRVAATVARAEDEATLRHEAICEVSASLARQLPLGQEHLAVIRTGTGRQLLGELITHSEVAERSIRLSRLVRQALKLRIGETVWLEPAEPGMVRTIVVQPFADVSTASGHGLEQHVKASLAERKIPISEGLIVYVSFPESVAGTLYKVSTLEGEPGFVDDDTYVKLEHTLDMESVWAHWGDLPVREQRLLMMRFYGNMTQAEIGERLGISQMHVSRLLAGALSYLRERVLGQDCGHEQR